MPWRSESSTIPGSEQENLLSAEPLWKLPLACINLGFWAVDISSAIIVWCVASHGEIAANTVPGYFMKGVWGWEKDQGLIGGRKWRGKTAEGRPSTRPRNGQTARMRYGVSRRGKMDEERMERIKEATTEAQSPLNPSLTMMVGCGVGTASYSTAPF